VPGQTGASITVSGTGQGLMNAECFLTAAISLTRHIDDGDHGAFLRLVLISGDDFIHNLGQTPAFEQTNLAIAGADKPIVRISHHGDKPHRLFTQKSISHFQRRWQTVDRFGASAQGVEPVQASQGIRTHERSP
jgi:hypothetical protein